MKAGQDASSSDSEGSLKQDVQSPHQTQALYRSCEETLSSEQLIFTSELLWGEALEKNIVMFPGQPLSEREVYVQELVLPLHLSSGLPSLAVASHKLQTVLLLSNPPKAFGGSSCCKQTQPLGRCFLKPGC